MLEHPRSSPPIASWPTRSRTEEHPCWLGRGTPHAIWTNSPLLHNLIRCRQLGCSACLTRWSFQVGVGSCARHRHIPYERPACAPQNQCLPIWAFSIRMTNVRLFFRNQDATSWGKRSCYAIVVIIIVRLLYIINRGSVSCLMFC